MGAQIYVLQHAADTPPGLFGEWLELRQLEHEVLRPDRGEVVPRVRDCLALIVLGSEHSVTASDPAWIADEIALTRDAVEMQVPVLGICFGGQMLAVAMGAAVQPSPRPFIGWHEVTADRSSPVAGAWLHFNYETFSLPAGARSLADLDGQTAAFRAGPSLAVQFHPEATVEIVDSWVRWDAERLTRLDIDAGSLTEATVDRREDARRRAFGLFDTWLSGW